MMRRLVVMLVACWLTFSGAAQAQQPTPAMGIQAPVAPVEARADRTITFRIAAPTATEVDVFLPGLTPNRYPLAKGADGVWTANVGPFEANMYDYSFLIGGARVNSGRFEIAGNPPRSYEPRNVPHGSVTMHTYEGKVQNRARSLNVYLPPEYYSQPRRRFPVLYLFSGMSEEDWVRPNRVNVIMDNLIADRKVVPMIVVMPNNTTGPLPRPALENAAIMEREIIGEIIPMIDGTYRTMANRNQRAITGVSFGGGTAFTVGMRHLEAFGYIGEFGTGAFGGGERTSYAPGYVDYNPDNITPGLYAKLTNPATKPHLFFMSVGDADPRAPFQKSALAAFQRSGFQPVFKSYPGGHEWRVFVPAFEDFVPLLFK